MAIQSRPYLVTTPTERRLIEATTPAGAIRHVVKATISAFACNARDVAMLMSQGLKYEQAEQAEQAELPGIPPAEVSAPQSEAAVTALSNAE